MLRRNFTSAQTIDQQNLTGSSTIGFGEFAGMRYRGQVFTPTQSQMGFVAFSLTEIKVADMGVYLIDVNQTTNIPTGSVLASWTIPVGSLVVGYNAYNLSPVYNGLISGHKYAVFFGPLQNGLYLDDYKDCILSNANPYSGGVSIFYEASAGAWQVDSALDFVFAIGSTTQSSRTVAGSRTTAGARKDWFGNSLPASSSAQAVPRGISISGMEFGASSTQPTYSYFAGKGFNTARLAFNWERLQPSLNGSLDPTELATLDQQITYAGLAGIKVILDCHNFGRRTVISAGGFTDDFTTSPQATFSVPYGDQDSGAGTFTFRDYGRGTAGVAANPVSPATGYVFQLDFRINSSPNSFDELFIDVYYTSETLRYCLVINQQQSTWQFRKYINSSAFTVLASGTKTWTLGTYYTCRIDVAQGTVGKINCTINGSNLWPTGTVNTDAGLTGGLVSIMPDAMNVTVKTVSLNVNGSTSGGGGALHIVGDGTLTTAHLANLWSQLATRYVSNATVYGYDIMNEPHDMPVPTTTSNYNTTATVTLMHQASITAIRLIDSSKYIFCEFDSWAGGQSFTSQYTSNPTPFLTDSASKLVYSFHYYMDNDHSGTYPIAFASSNNTNITTELADVLAWKVTRSINLHCGEYGVPNTSEWQVCLTTLLGLLNTNHIWANHWAAGDPYTSPTTIQPTGTNPNFVDRLQMAIVGAAANLGTLL